MDPSYAYLSALLIRSKPIDRSPGPSIVSSGRKPHVNKGYRIDIAHHNEIKRKQKELREAGRGK